MSILIKGMEMPKNEELIIICSDGTVEMTNNDGCRVYEQKAIELPSHGRLIDADAMEKEVCGGCKHGEHKYENCIDCALANAPTIIESEREDDSRRMEA